MRVFEFSRDVHGILRQHLYLIPHAVFFDEAGKKVLFMKEILMYCHVPEPSEEELLVLRCKDVLCTELAMFLE
jgi:hypothetical protein